MPFYGGPAGGTTFTGPYLPPNQQLLVGDLPLTLFTTADGATSAALQGKASIAVALPAPPKDTEQARVISISGVFSGAPGVFEIDWQSADVDADGMYVSEATTISAVNANQAFHAAITVKAKFGRAFIKTLPNNVSLILTVNT